DVRSWAKHVGVGRGEPKRHRDAAVPAPARWHGRPADVGRSVAGYSPNHPGWSVATSGDPPPAHLGDIHPAPVVERHPAEVVAADPDPIAVLVLAPVAVGHVGSEILAHFRAVWD